MSVESEHFLALKVMRLTTPTLVSSSIISCEPFDLPQNSFRQAMQNEATAVGRDETLDVGQFLLLPQSFGNIYLGETFSSYICVHNCTSHAVEGVTVKADLQSNTTRISLPMHENQTKPTTLGPKDTLDDVIRYEVKEIGTHILVCEVNYTTPAGLPQYFRKFFKFQVLKPLDVKTKFYNVDMDEIYLEAGIQNITSSPLCLETVELDPSENYTVASLNTLPNGESVFTSKNMLQPNNICQFLYCIKPKPEIAKDIKRLQQCNTIGKIDIVWHTNMGEKGRLQTSQLQRLPFEYKDVRLEVIEANNIAKVSEPFTFKCRITNTSDRQLNLRVKLENEMKRGSRYIASSDFELGLLEPGERREFPLTVCPAKLGLVKISPLLLINTLQKEEYSIEKVVDVFVVDADYNENESFNMLKHVRYARPKSTKDIEDQMLQLQVV